MDHSDPPTQTADQQPAVQAADEPALSEAPVPEVHQHAGRSLSLADPVFRVDDVSVWYGDYEAVRDVTLDIGRQQITAMIGPSGCGKSTMIRCLNRMNDLIPGARVEGKITYHDEDMYADYVDPI